jgi:hypothetical protein
MQMFTPTPNRARSAAVRILLAAAACAAGFVLLAPFGRAEAGKGIGVMLATIGTATADPYPVRHAHDPSPTIRDHRNCRGGFGGVGPCSTPHRR